jgi:peptide-methionine (S)-S-oxide reductase
MNSLWRLLLLAGLALSGMNSLRAEEKPVKPETLVLGGGCFWCLEGAFEIVPGVLNVENGYAGGRVQNPSYEQVCSGETGHAEVVRITYDPAKVGLERLFELFWKVHDPTSLNRQGADMGTQYRSIILYATEAQKKAAQEAIAKEQPLLARPIVTELVPLINFYLAEEYHQDYFQKHPNQGYCQAVVRPKVEKIKKEVERAQRAPGEGH